MGKYFNEVHVCSLIQQMSDASAPSGFPVVLEVRFSYGM